ncbi:diguanylate cyclase [Rheinheimera gaetbuli]
MSSTRSRADLSAAFSSLRLRFESGLAERSANMLSLAEQPLQSDLAIVVAEAHKLAGACGTFGYAVLGSHARHIEQLAKELSSKVGDERLQALPALRQALLEFDTAVKHALQGDGKAEVENNTTLHHSDSVWLLLPYESLTDDLSRQLHAFGHNVECFTDFSSCLKRLQSAAPAVLLAAINTEQGAPLFDQTLLLKQLKQHGSHLLVFSEKDDFDLRVKAAQQRAEAFFVSPLDVPNMVSAISDLMENGTRRQGRVFIVDDDKLLAQHYALVLKSAGIKTHIIGSVRQIVCEVIDFQPDILLMDMYMPEYSGAELAGIIRQYPSLKRLPIVFLSSEINKTLQLSAMAYGADDFLTKPIDDAQLVQAIKTRLKRSMQLKNLIEKDSLTALIKHSAIKEVAELEYENSQRYGKPFSVVMVDIDHFKGVNDTYGHATGDMVITALATLLRKRIRKTDKAGRYGGEEFMLVLPSCTRQQAATLTQQILDAFRQLTFTASGKHFNCTFSAGVISSEESHFSSAGQMIEAADKALYQAKRAGRNQVC